MTVSMNNIETVREGLEAAMASLRVESIIKVRETALFLAIKGQDKSSHLYLGFVNVYFGFS